MCTIHYTVLNICYICNFKESTIFDFTHMHRHVSSPELEEPQGSLCVLKVIEEMTVQKDKKKKLLAFGGQSCKG